jgi:hypothetical protein
MKLSIRVINKAQTEFWIRMFKLESQIEWAVRQLTGPRKRITVPIMAEFVVEPDLKWIYCLVLFIDPIGLQNGFGYVYGCDSDPEDQKIVYEFRDHFADSVMRELEKGPGIDETYIIPEGKEEADLPPSKERHRP